MSVHLLTEHYIWSYYEVLLISDFYSRTIHLGDFHLYQSKTLTWQFYFDSGVTFGYFLLYYKNRYFKPNHDDFLTLTKYILGLNLIKA